MRKQGKEVAPAEDISGESVSADQPTPTLTTQTKSGFMLWLDHNRDQLELEHPEAMEAELVRLAAQKFKTLSDDERQVHCRKLIIL